MAINEGQVYEEKIRSILKEKDLYPPIIKHNNDAGFIHRGVPYFIEVKNTNAHDFGQKKLIWNQIGGWQWNKKDEITDLYDGYGIIDKIKKNFIPKKFTVRNDANFKSADREFDQTNFESGTIEIDDFTAINRYYAKKDCYYIQIEDRGFYFLERDDAVLGGNIQPFKPRITMRLRAKRHHRLPHYDYTFFAVLIAYPKSVFSSRYDIEPQINKEFPPIVKDL
ncbi:MAG: hypothetical protein M3033_14720 [Acidobacteriota bacterium]|nr:hypothetical protein [Acidobacteriota bacterium]